MPKKNKTYWLVGGGLIGVLALLIAGYTITHPSHQTQSQSQPTTTFQGRVVCLPYKNTSGPQTLECAVGFKTDQGNLYAITANSLQQKLASLAGSDKKVKITGVFKKGASAKYQSEGTIMVSDFSVL